MRRRGTGLGAISLILIFSVLCLAIFALLAISTASSDRALARKLAESTARYYAADTQAACIAAELKTVLLSGGVLERIQGVPIESDDGRLHYSVPVDGGRSIAVILLWDGSELEIVAWRETENENWMPDEGLDVWGGE